MTNLILHGASSQASTVVSSTGFDQKTGIAQNVVHCHFPIYYGTNADGSDKLLPFPTALANAYWAKNQVMMLTFGTWNLGTHVAWTWPDVQAGKHDPALHALAKASATFGHGFFLRLDHEMNGDWSPWFMPPADFVKMWEYIFDIFQAERATNATFVWCPNQLSAVGSASSTAADKLQAWMPNPKKLHWSGFDAYNWGNVKSPTGSFQTFSQVIDLTYKTIDKLLPGVPMAICEFNSHDAPGDKRAWIRDAYVVAMPRYPLIRAAIWFDKTDTTMPNQPHWILTPAEALVYADALRAGPYSLQMPLPPDGTPIKPLQSLTLWGDPIGDMATNLKMVNQLVSDLTDTVKASNVLTDNANAVIASMTRANALAQTDADAAKSRLAGIGAALQVLIRESQAN